MSGGVGMTWDFRSNGTAEVNYNGAVIFIAGQAITYTGYENWKAQDFKDLSATTGSYEAIPTGGVVMASSEYGGTHQVTEGAHYTTWTCQGNSAKLDVNAGGGLWELYTLQRTSH
jgi:hypothetical protein